MLLQTPKTLTNLKQSFWSPKHNNNDWNEECSKSIALRRKAKRIYTKHINQTKKIAYQKATAEAKRKIKKKNERHGKIFVPHST